MLLQYYLTEVCRQYSSFVLSWWIVHEWFFFQIPNLTHWVEGVYHSFFFIVVVVFITIHLLSQFSDHLTWISMKKVIQSFIKLSQLVCDLSLRSEFTFLKHENQRQSILWDIASSPYIAQISQTTLAALNANNSKWCWKCSVFSPNHSIFIIWKYTNISQITKSNYTFL